MTATTQRDGAATPGRGHVRREMAPGRFFRRWPLMLLTVGGALLEAALLVAFGGADELALAPQLTAPAPFGVLHDLRWLAVYHNRWWVFALGAAAAVLFRAAFMTVAWKMARPPEADEAPWLKVFSLRLGFTLFLHVLLIPWVVLLFAMGVISLSSLYFVALGPILAVAFVAHHGMTMPGWYRCLPTLRTTIYAGLTFIVMTLGATALSFSPTWLRFVEVAAMGLWNAWAWYGIVHGVATRAQPTRGNLAFGPPGAIAAAAVVAVGAALVFGDPGAPVTGDPAAPPSTGEPVLVVNGFGSSWNGKPDDQLPAPYADQRYSYAGVTPDGRFLPYGPEATHRSLGVLVQRMAEQVEVLRRVTGRPVSIVAQSEGSVVTKAYLASADDPPIDQVVYASPLIRLARVYYPPASNEGWGVATKWGLKGVIRFSNRVTGWDFSADIPLLRSILDHGPALRNLITCPVPGIEETFLQPLAAAVATHPPDGTPIPFIIQPGFHGSVLTLEEARATVVDLLAGRDLSQSSFWRGVDVALRGASSAWLVPALGVHFVPAWNDHERPIDTSRRCAATFDVLQADLPTR